MYKGYNNSSLLFPDGDFPGKQSTKELVYLVQPCVFVSIVQKAMNAICVVLSIADRPLHAH